MDYEEINAVRRTGQLMRLSDGLDFSVLNAIVWILLVAIVIAAVGSIF